MTHWSPLPNLGTFLGNFSAQVGEEEEARGFFFLIGGGERLSESQSFNQRRRWRGVDDELRLFGQQH